VVGAELLGATTLQDYGVALFVGLLSGAYSSIFIASPVLAMLKEREPRYAAIRQRLESRSDRSGVLTPSAAAALAGASAAGRPATSAPRKGQGGGAIRPGTATAVAPEAPDDPSESAGGEESTTVILPGGGRQSVTGRPPPRPRSKRPTQKNKKRR